MKVTIQEFFDNGSTRVVRFNSYVGSGWAIWNSSTAPVRGNTYDVEFDIGDMIDLSRNTQVRTDVELQLCGDVSNLRLIVVVEEQDNDGMACLRLSPDCLIMVESIERDLKGKYLELTVPIETVELSPIGS